MGDKYDGAAYDEGGSLVVSCFVDEISGMNRQKLAGILEKGVESRPNQYGNFDIHSLKLRGDYALCQRRWSQDDFDMNDDSGESHSIVPRAEIEKFLDDVVADSSGTRTFRSVNSFSSCARYSEFPTPARIDVRDYLGFVQINIALEKDKVRFRFLPSQPEVPGKILSVRLSRGEDYL